jgi:hypothetical protein
MKKIKKTGFAIPKNIISLLLFLAGPLAFHFKEDMYSLRRCSYESLNRAKWRRIEKDLPNCSVIGRRSVMGRSTLGV